MSRPARRFLGGFGTQEWGNDRVYASLLDALTRDRVETEALEHEISAPAQQSADLQKMEREELEEARREVTAFRAALEDAHQRTAGDPGAEVPYDSRDPTQDAAADVLIQYLVRPGYADVRTEEPHSEHYVYYVRVDWPKLGGLAKEHGLDLPG